MSIDDRSGKVPGKNGIPEHRTAEQRRADSVRVRRQLAVLTSAGEQARIERIITQLQARQELAPRRYALRFDRYPVTTAAGRASYVLVARGQLVVRVSPGKDGATAVDRALAALRYRWADSMNRSRDVHTEVFEGDKRPDELAADVKTLRAQGITAAPNIVVPLGTDVDPPPGDGGGSGHIIKGDNYPSATAGPGPYPPPNVTTNAATDVRVAVIDTGITPEMRADGWLAGVTRASDNTDPLDILPDNGAGGGDGRLDWFAGHGTFAAGVVQRVAPDCEIVAYRFTRSDGLGTAQDVANAMLLAAEEAARDGVRLIINASLGTPGIGGEAPLSLSDAVATMKEKYPDVLIVASAGNNGSTEPMYPAAMDHVVAVGALTDDLRGAPFSSRGKWVDCSTVGVGVVSTFVAGTLPPEVDPLIPDFTFPANSWTVWTGTSFSAPQISGAVAVLCQNTPGLSPRAALDALLAGRPTLADFGRILRILPGTPG
ncbi:MAG TPA: S8/S53 family peptidase [Catenuloplanes sp.]|jgi:hypothetical protein